MRTSILDNSHWEALQLRPYSSGAVEGHVDRIKMLNQVARDLGWLRYHTHDSRRSLKGFPDLVLIHEQQQRCVFSDVKTHRGWQSSAQRDGSAIYVP